MKACFLNSVEGKLHSYSSCICLRDALAFTTVNSRGEVLKRKNHFIQIKTEVFVILYVSQ